MSKTACISFTTQTPQYTHRAAGSSTLLRQVYTYRLACHQSLACCASAAGSLPLPLPAHPDPCHWAPAEDPPCTPAVAVQHNGSPSSPVFQNSTLEYLPVASDITVVAHCVCLDLHCNSMLHYLTYSRFAHDMSSNMYDDSL